MNLKVPTLLFSRPIHVPMGGLLMMSMTSPRWKNNSLRKLPKPSSQNTADGQMLCELTCMDGLCLNCKFSDFLNFTKRCLPWVWGSLCRRGWGWSLYGLGRGRRTVLYRAALHHLHPPTSHFLCCWPRNPWCSLSGHLDTKQNKGGDRLQLQLDSKQKSWTCYRDHCFVYNYWQTDLFETIKHFSKATQEHRFLTLSCADSKQQTPSRS